MSTILDPTDKSKLFGSKLNDLILAVQEFEQIDLMGQLSDIAYLDFMTPDEHTTLYAWARESLETTPEVKEILAKCPHQYAVATWLQLMITGGE